MPILRARASAVGCAKLAAKQPETGPMARAGTATHDFTWAIPERFNIGAAVLDRWAAEDPGRTALIEVDADGRPRLFSFQDLTRLSNRLANVLAAAGLHRGDRVGILLPQRH